MNAFTTISIVNLLTQTDLLYAGLFTAGEAKIEIKGYDKVWDSH